MRSVCLSGWLVARLAERIRGWVREGKLDEDTLDRALSPDARAFLDHALSPGDWADLADVEGLVALVADQLGGETGLVDWADALVADWIDEPEIAEILASGHRLVDGPGYVVGRASERLVRHSTFPAWQYEGGRTRFSVRLEGVAAVGPALKALVGAILARLAAASDVRSFDVRFEGVDVGSLVVFGELADDTVDQGSPESRLARAALVA